MALEMDCYNLIIVSNFGFMYNPAGKFIFMIFVASLLFWLSILGKIVFALLVAVMLTQIYVHYAFPKYELFMKKTHFNGDVTAATSATVSTV